jgi:catechol 2,3-dioxygenase-like lactoylglutathione lyase family enzyme
MTLTPHHVGCAVLDMESGYSTFSHALGLARQTRPIPVESQGVSVAFLELQPDFYLELVAPQPGNSRLTAYLKAGFYHLCFLAEDVAEARRHLKERRFSPLAPFESEAFDGAECQFFVTPQGHLVELAGLTPQRFRSFFASRLRES